MVVICMVQPVSPKARSAFERAQWVTKLATRPGNPSCPLTSTCMHNMLAHAHVRMHTHTPFIKAYANLSLTRLAPISLFWGLGGDREAFAVKAHMGEHTWRARAQGSNFSFFLEGADKHLLLRLPARGKIP